MGGRGESTEGRRDVAGISTSTALRPRPRPPLRQQSICGLFDPGSLIAPPPANRRTAISPRMFFPPSPLAHLRNCGSADSTCSCHRLPVISSPCRVRPSLAHVQCSSSSPHATATPSSSVPSPPPYSRPVLQLRGRNSRRPRVQQSYPRTRSIRLKTAGCSVLPPPLTPNSQRLIGPSSASTCRQRLFIMQSGRLVLDTLTNVSENLARVAKQTTARFSAEAAVTVFWHGGRTNGLRGTDLPGSPRCRLRRVQIDGPFWSCKPNALELLIIDLLPPGGR